MSSYQTYCVFCKRKTATKNAKVVQTQNDRWALKGICAMCGHKKSQFVSQGFKKKSLVVSQGRGLVNDLLNSGKLPELHIPGGFQYCGPGTMVEKRVRAKQKGISDLDSACFNHDLGYKVFKDTEDRHFFDEILKEKATKIMRDTTASLSERAAAALVTGVMATKLKLGMGRNKKLI